MENLERMIDKEDLTEIAKAVEIMRYTMQEITMSFFNRFNSDDVADHPKIAWEFNRNRARAALVDDYLLEIEKLLEEHDIAYWSFAKNREEKESVA
jgi:hypothetical protein